MAGERNGVFATKMFEGPESEIHTNDGFRVDLNTKRLHEILSTDNNLPILILVSGTSESGKSHLGQKFVADKAGHRFKIYKTISDLMQSHGLPQVDGVEGFDSVSFASHIQDNHELQAETTQRVAAEYLRIMKETGVRVGIVETLKHPWLVEELLARDDLRVVSLYIDAPFELRVSRQAKKRGISREVVALDVQEKDRHKSETGTDEIRGSADIVVWNAGTIETFDSFIETLERSLRNHSRDSSMNTADYS